MSALERSWEDMRALAGAIGARFMISSAASESGKLEEVREDGSIWIVEEDGTLTDSGRRFTGVRALR